MVTFLVPHRFAGLLGLHLFYDPISFPSQVPDDHPRIQSLISSLPPHAMHRHMCQRIHLAKSALGLVLGYDDVALNVL